MKIQFMLMILCTLTTGCHRAQLSSEQGKISPGDWRREPPTPKVSHNGCVRASRDTVILRDARYKFAAHRLSDGMLLWTHESSRAQLLTCTSKGVMLMESAYGGAVLLIDYDSGETLETHQWTRPSLDSYDCSEVSTLPLPGDVQGFAWQLTPSYTHGGHSPSPEEQDLKHSRGCCMRGTAELSGDTLNSITHEYYTDYYDVDGHSCDMTRVEEKDASAQGIDERKLGQDIGVLLSLPEDLMNPVVRTTSHGEFEPGQAMFTQYVDQECGPTYARTGIATRGATGTWSALWSTEGFMESFCPIP